MDVKHQATFEKAKLRRILDREGVPFIFLRSEKNDFKEPTGKAHTVAELTGIYHESISYVKTEKADGGNVQKKPCPMILCEWDKVVDILRHDYVVIHGRRYEVQGIKNIAELNVAADISLEVDIQDGVGV